ncbi:MAG: hypothetical protein A2Y38_00560 [Spirochaetes bacterium GWB1_59_5]|nr:MAG: hypothetical protein A2Y38_00560 [Spirochaetes bacterium GWB1_59_5]
MAKYNVGDWVWAARAGHRDVISECPVCFGKLAVMLTLGNGEAFTLPCSYCGVGYTAPCGTVKEVQYVSGAEKVRISSVSVESTDNGEQVSYQSDHWILYAEDIFDTEVEALARCVEKAAKLNEEQTTRAEYLKGDKKKSFAWNASYHLREAKRHEKQAEYHRRNALLCKEKGKEDQPPPA